MKKISFFAISILFSMLIFSCATTEPASHISEEKNSELHVNGKVPQILDMGFSNILGGKSTSVTKIKAGEPAVIFFKLKDSDWDLSKIVIVPEKNGKKEAAITVEIDYQYEEEFVFAQGLQSPEEKGKWIFTATVYDHMGNRSKSSSASIVVE